MIDLILWAADKPTLATFAQSHNLLLPDGEGGTRRRDGFDWCWWAGSGKLMTRRAVVAGDVEVTPARYLDGVVAMMRLYFADDRLDPGDDPEGDEQWKRSKVAKYIRDNGTPGSLAGGSIRYYEIDDVRLFRAADVQGWLASEGLPGHEWLGGNRF